MVVVQMHGEPGSGKSILAKALGEALPAVVVDKDVIKSALLRSGVAEQVAGPAAYEAYFDLCAEVLRQRYSVVLDNPVYWPMVEEKSLRLARDAGASHVMIECLCPDREELARRLSSRERRHSQPTTPLDLSLLPGAIEPKTRRLTLDTSRPVEELVQQALGYITSGAAL